MKYTDYYNPALAEQFYCAKVSHHYYWFETYQDLLNFENSNWFDPRMTTHTPAEGNL